MNSRNLNHITSFFSCSIQLPTLARFLSYNFHACPRFISIKISLILKSCDVSLIPCLLRIPAALLVLILSRLWFSRQRHQNIQDVQRVLNNQSGITFYRCNEDIRDQIYIFEKCNVCGYISFFFSKIINVFYRGIVVYIYILFLPFSNS